MNHLNQMLDSFEHRKVLVLGDIMLDRYLSGKVSRISPEAPVPVLNYEGKRSCLGGAANVALNLRGLGAEVYLAGLVGKDEEGEMIHALLDEKSIDASCVVTGDRMTTSKTRVMSADQHLLRVDRENIHPLDDHEHAALMDAIGDLLQKKAIELVIFQDYNKGVLTKYSIETFIGLFSRAGIKICVDPKFENFYTYTSVDIFKPNLLELRTSLPFSVEPTLESLRRAAQYLRDKLFCKIIMITLSDDGIYINAEQEDHLLPVARRSIIDVCGAGDTVISMASLAYLSGFGLREVAYWSSFAGTLTCQYPGVVPITSALLKAEDH